jgi:hypothetical protein
MWISEREGNIIKAVKLFKILDPDEEKERALKATEAEWLSILLYLFLVVASELESFHKVLC